MSLIWLPYPCVLCDLSDLLTKPIIRRRFNFFLRFYNISKVKTVVQLPSVELLESRHAFPCHFTFKVIGAAKDNFTARVVACVRDELRMEIDPPFTIRNTEHGRHVSVTIEPMCETVQQVLAIYSRLSGMDGLVMLL